MFVSNSSPDIRPDAVHALTALRSDDALVATAKGEIPARHLQPGDMVLTRDNGLQPVRRTVWVSDVAERGLRAVTIATGALGNGMPHSDTMLSANHRVLVTGDLAAMLFDETLAMVAARHLIGLAGVSEVTPSFALGIEFDHHEMILVNGCWTECVTTGAGTEDAAQARAVEELTQTEQFVAANG